MLARHNSQTVQLWLKGENLNVQGAAPKGYARKMEVSKVKFFGLNVQAWRGREKLMVQAAEFGCFAWLPSTST